MREFFDILLMLIVNGGWIIIVLIFFGLMAELSSWEADKRHDRGMKEFWKAYEEWSKGDRKYLCPSSRDYV